MFREGRVRKREEIRLCNGIEAKSNMLSKRNNRDEGKTTTKLLILR